MIGAPLARRRLVTLLKAAAIAVGVALPFLLFDLPRPAAVCLAVAIYLALFVLASLLRSEPPR